MPDATNLPRELGVFPIRNDVLFPGTRRTIEVVRPRTVAFVESLDASAGTIVAVLTQRDLAEERPGADDLHAIGTAARVVDVTHHEGIGYVVTVDVVSRIRLGTLVAEEPFLRAAVTPLDESDRSGEVARAASLRQRAYDTVTAARAELDALGDDTSPHRVAAIVATHVEASAEERLEVLAADDVQARLEKLEVLVARQHAKQDRIAHLQPPKGDDLAQVWPLEDGAEERIERSLRGGSMTEDEARDLRTFIEKGYVVWERLIDDAAIDAYVADIRDIANRPGKFVSTDHKRTRPFRLTGSDFDTFESVFDTYVNLETARRVCFHPKIVRFLQLLFDARPVAIQQLLFQRSNQHPVHQDTAYVCVRDSLLMAATWIALEDVVPGRGELTYYEGSHRIPHYLYKDGSKRFNPELDDAKASQDELLRRAEAMGCQKHDFIAKKGDVFLWAADLLHASNPRTRPEAETRMSCVTHYCPETSEPLFFWLHPELSTLQAYGDGAFYASSFYHLPQHELATPIFEASEPC